MTIRILVVDDFEQWRLAVRSILDRIPRFRVVGEASDGDEAVRQATLLSPDVVLLDVGMPRLNGIEAAKQIRQSRPESRIIFLTQERDSDIRDAALAAGATAYLSKLHASDELQVAIDIAMLTTAQTARAKLSV